VDLGVGWPHAMAAMSSEQTQWAELIHISTSLQQQNQSLLHNRNIIKK
jgi:hypothetical protein